MASELIIVLSSEAESSGGMVAVLVDWLTVLEGARSVLASCILVGAASFLD